MDQSQTTGFRDLKDARRIARAVRQVSSGLEDGFSRLGLRKGRPYRAHDLREVVEEIPGLVVLVEVGLSRPSSFHFLNGRYRVGMEFPWRPAANRRLSAPPAFDALCHEVAHLVIGHEPDAAYVADGPGYHNHPHEVEADMHVVLARYAGDVAAEHQDIGWDDPGMGGLVGERDDFVRDVMGLYPHRSYGALTPTGRDKLRARLADVWESAQRCDATSGYGG